jgi:hypothetical protein
MSALQPQFPFGNIKKSLKVRDGERMAVIFAAVAAAHGVVYEQVWCLLHHLMSALHVFLQPPQNSALEFQFMVYPCATTSLYMMPSVSRKEINIDLTLLQTCYVLFGIGEFGVYERDDCCVSRSFITSNDSGDEVRVIFSVFLWLPEDNNTVLLSVA